MSDRVVLFKRTGPALSTQRQNIVNVIMQSRLSEAFNRRLETYVSRFPRETIILENDLTNPECSDAIEAALYVLNYHEFICAAILRGELNERLCRDFFEGIYRGLHKKTRFLVANRRVESKAAFQHFYKIAKRWSICERSESPLVRPGRDVSIHDLSLGFFQIVLFIDLVFAVGYQGRERREQHVYIVLRYKCQSVQWLQ